MLMPKTLVSLPSNFAIPAWYAVISRVQPPVKAAGKNASTTVFFPRKLESVTFPPWVEGKVKSGAMSPSFSVVCGGWMFWANRFAANKPAPNASNFVMPYLTAVALAGRPRPTAEARRRKNAARMASAPAPGIRLDGSGVVSSTSI